MRKPILCAGRLYCDLVFTDVPRLPTLGTEVFAPGLSLHAGGGAFISGATLAALGHPVSQCSILPAAPFDAVVLAELAAHGVSASQCRAAEGADPQVTVAIGSAGDRAFLTRADGPALPDLRRVDFQRFAHLHIGELRTLEDNPGLLTQAKAAGLTVSLDCGWQDAFAPDVAGLIAAVDVFLPNAAEAEALTRIGVPKDCAALTVIKDGERGARARRRTDTDWTHVPASPVPVLDATGAGDAFNGGFLSQWLDGQPLERCIGKGNACGAATVQIVGGAGALKDAADGPRAVARQ